MWFTKPNMDINHCLVVFMLIIEAVVYIQCQATNDGDFVSEDYCVCRAQSLSFSEMCRESLQLSLTKLDKLEALQKYDTEVVQNVQSEVQNLTKAFHLVKQDYLQQTENLARLVNLTEHRFSDVDASLSSIVDMLQSMNSTLFQLTQRVQLIEDKAEKDVPCQISDEQFCLRKRMSNFYGSCYSFVRDKLVNWTDARKYCKEVFGADLVAIETETENNYLKDKVRANPGNAKWGFWISLASTNDTWHWESTGEVLHGFNDWTPGEPNNAAEDCGHMRADFRSDSIYKYTWNNMACQEVMHFICELKL